MEPATMSTASVTFSIPHDLNKALRESAALNGMTVSEFAQECMETKLGRKYPRQTPARKPSDNRRIDGVKLGYYLAKKQVTFADLSKAGKSGYFTADVWTKMLAGMRPCPRNWCVVCNLLGVPVDHFDLKPEPAAVVTPGVPPLKVGAPYDFATAYSEFDRAVLGQPGASGEPALPAKYLRLWRVVQALAPWLGARSVRRLLGSARRAHTAAMDLLEQELRAKMLTLLSTCAPAPLPAVQSPGKSQHGSPAKPAPQSAATHAGKTKTIRSTKSVSSAPSTKPAA
jgi:hypothetical protein